MLVVYPVAVALLIGFAFSRGSDKPTVAVLDQVPPDEQLQIGNQRLGALLGKAELARRVKTIDVSSRDEAERKVRDGDALAALIIPADTVRKATSQLDQSQIELLVNEEDPVKGQLVDDTISSLVAAQNRRVSRALIKENLQYLQLLLKGGTVNVLGNEFTVLGLRRIEQITRTAKRALPRGSPVREQLDQVIRFNTLAQENFDLGARALTAASEPIRVRKQVLNGGRVPLTSFAAALAVAVSLMFVTVLLASGSLALERTENAFSRLVRGPVSRTALLGEKVLLAGAVGLVVTLLMVLVLGVFVALEWDRFPLWLVALVVGAHRLRGVRHRARRGRPRHVRCLAARVHGAAAARVLRARAVGGREPLALRPDARGVGCVSVQGHRCRRSRRPSTARAAWPARCSISPRWRPRSGWPPALQ